MRTLAKSTASSPQIEEPASPQVTGPSSNRKRTIARGESLILNLKPKGITFGSAVVAEYEELSVPNSCVEVVSSKSITLQADPPLTEMYEYMDGLIILPYLPKCVLEWYVCDAIARNDSTAAGVIGCILEMRWPFVEPSSDDEEYSFSDDEEDD